MIIDAHGHVSAPSEVYAYKAQLIASRGRPELGRPSLSTDQHEAALQRHLSGLDAVGTDVQLISPRPFQMMHSSPPRRIVESWTGFVNDVIAEHVRLYPDRFVGVAGLPQFQDQSPTNCLVELERCVRELGFVGCLLNPDPMEGRGVIPGLGDRFWYPLYEKLVELDVPAHIHSAGCVSERESYTLHFINEESIAILELLDSDVFRDFPSLKLMISHGGGAIPYQVGRFCSWRIRKSLEPFEEALRKLYYDTCIYSADAIDLLTRTVGSDRVMFGTEFPGTGSAVDPATGRSLDDLRPVIEEMPSLTDDQRREIFEDNARSFFKLDGLLAGRPVSATAGQG